MRVVCVIPSRYESSRFPGKPLADLCGKPMIQHVYERVLRAKTVTEAAVATDDRRIFDAVEKFGGRAIMTAGRHLNAALESKDFPQGLGSRHIAAAGMTSITHAIAIVTSESTGNVSVFKNGRILVTIEKPIE